VATMRICKVCGKEFELKPDHKGLATMCRPDCQPPDKPKRLWWGGGEYEIVRSFTIEGLAIREVTQCVIVHTKEPQREMNDAD
jgi:hypothetical protein